MYWSVCEGSTTATATALATPSSPIVVIIPMVGSCANMLGSSSTVGAIDTIVIAITRGLGVVAGPCTGSHTSEGCKPLSLIILRGILVVIRVLALVQDAHIWSSCLARI